MNQELQRQLQAWVDGELSPAEARDLADRVRQDAEAQALCENLRRVTAVLKAHEPAPQVPESREFYWSKIHRGILESEAGRATRSRPEPAAARPDFSRWLAWLLPVGACAMAALLLVPRFARDQGPGGLAAARAGNAQPIVGHEVESPSDQVTTLTFYSAQDSMTVVWLGNVDLL